MSIIDQLLGEELAASGVQKKTPYSYTPLQKVNQGYRNSVDRALSGSELEQKLKPYLYAMAETESKWNPSAVSNVGAKGLLQLMPINYKKSDAYGAEIDPLNPDANAARALQVLNWARETAKRNLSADPLRQPSEKEIMTEALRIYNAGTREKSKSSKEAVDYSDKVSTIADMYSNELGSGVAKAKKNQDDYMWQQRLLASQGKPNDLTRQQFRDSKLLGLGLLRKEDQKAFDARGGVESLQSTPFGIDASLAGNSKGFELDKILSLVPEVSGPKGTTSVSGLPPLTPDELLGYETKPSKSAATGKQGNGTFRVNGDEKSVPTYVDWSPLKEFFREGRNAINAAGGSQLRSGKVEADENRNVAQYQKLISDLELASQERQLRSVLANQERAIAEKRIWNDLLGNVMLDERARLMYGAKSDGGSAQKIYAMLLAKDPQFQLLSPDEQIKRVTELQTQLGSK